MSTHSFIWALKKFDFLTLNQPTVIDIDGYVFEYRNGYQFRDEFVKDGYTAVSLKYRRKVCQHLMYDGCKCYQADFLRFK